MPKRVAELQHIVGVLDTDTGAMVDPGDSVNRAIRVTNVGGASGGGLSNTELRAAPVIVSNEFGGHAVTYQELTTSGPIPVTLGAGAVVAVTGELGAGDAVKVIVSDSGNAIVGKVKLVDTTGAIVITATGTALDVNVKTPVGQQLAAASIPVVLPAAQIVTLTPPAALIGFALEAGHLATIDVSTAKIPALGQALAAGSVPIVLTVAQLATLTPPAAIVGFALEAGHLATIDSHIPALGQAVVGASVPVVLPVAQITTLTPPAAIVGFNLEASQLNVLAAITAGAAADKATVTNSNPTYSESAVTALSQTPLGQLRVLDDAAPAIADLLFNILAELRIANLILHSTLNCRDDLDMLRMAV